MADDLAGKRRVAKAGGAGDRRDFVGAHAAEQPIDAEIGRRRRGSEFAVAVERDDFEERAPAAGADRLRQLAQRRARQADVLETEIDDAERQRRLDIGARVAAASRRRASP